MVSWTCICMSGQIALVKNFPANCTLHTCYCAKQKLHWWIIREISKRWKGGAPWHTEMTLELNRNQLFEILIQATLQQCTNMNYTWTAKATLACKQTKNTDAAATQTSRLAGLPGLPEGQTGTSTGARSPAHTCIQTTFALQDKGSQIILKFPQTSPGHQVFCP